VGDMSQPLLILMCHVCGSEMVAFDSKGKMLNCVTCVEINEIYELEQQEYQNELWHDKYMDKAGV